MLRSILWLTLILELGCSHEPPETTRKTVDLKGKALGTTWTVKIHSADSFDDAKLRHAIATEIEQNEKIFSHWRPDCELHKFNQTFTTSALTIHPKLHELLRHAAWMHRETNGTFDPTIAPLVNLWGFGPVSTDRRRIPKEAEIEGVLKQVGMKHLEILDSHKVRKKRPDLQLDFSGSAKGKIIDQLCILLNRLGYADYLVEIGGELRARGNGESGSGWKVGLEDGSGKHNKYLSSISLHNCAVATSGTYLQSKTDPSSGSSASHLIDPRNGRPVDNHLIAVNVLAPTALEADAWATAFMVLGFEKGSQIAKQKNIAALFHEMTPEGIKSRKTKKFPE